VRELFLVYQEHGGPWDWSKDLREQRLFGEHARFVDELVDRRTILLGGPLNEKDVLLIVDADSEKDVHALFADDPWFKERMLTIREVRPWTVFLDGTIIDT
jgi:uncharacterized protein YciI